MAKSTITKAEHGELHEVLQAEYEQAADGNFVLKLDDTPRGFVESARLDEMRKGVKKHEETAAGLAEKLKAFDGISDPAKALELLSKQSELDKGELIKAGDIEGLVKAEVEKISGPLNGQLAEMTKARDTAQEQADKSVVNTKVAVAASDFGKVRKGASSTIVAKALEQGWGNHAGELLQANGDGEIVGRDIDAWMAEGAAPGGDLAFCFEPSKGGGSEGNEDGGGGNDTETIDPNDRKSYRDNLADIASGKKQVGPLRRSA